MNVTTRSEPVHKTYTWDEIEKEEGVYTPIGHIGEPFNIVTIDVDAPRFYVSKDTFEIAADWSEYVYTKNTEALVVTFSNDDEEF